MEELVSRKEVLDAIFEWVSKGENEKDDAMQLLGDRIRSIETKNKIQ